MHTVDNVCSNLSWLYNFDQSTGQAQVSRKWATGWVVLGGGHNIFMNQRAKYEHLRWTHSSRVELLASREFRITEPYSRICQKNIELLRVKQPIQIT